MSIDTTRHAIDGYLEALLSCGDFGRFMSDDVTVTFMGTDRQAAGREAACGLITFVHALAFKTAIRVNDVVYGERRAMLEAEFVGTHIAEFEGVAASHRHVRVPYAVVYDVDDQLITALRIYFPLDLLMRQIAGASEAVSVVA
jgi:hypothetical protein